MRVSVVARSPATHTHTAVAFKTHSHLLKLSVAHALAQSTLLAHYETHATRILSSPRTVSIPQQLASTGVLSLSRKEALRLTGRLFTLRRDVNLVSNVLDVPELFWSEASLKALYDAVREYMEIGGRVQVLNEKLAVAEDLVRLLQDGRCSAVAETRLLMQLQAIHDHLNNNAMERITWIIIWYVPSFRTPGRCADVLQAHCCSVSCRKRKCPSACDIPPVADPRIRARSSRD